MLMQNRFWVKKYFLQHILGKTILEIFLSLPLMFGQNQGELYSGNGQMSPVQILTGHVSQ